MTGGPAAGARPGGMPEGAFYVPLTRNSEGRDCTPDGQVAIPRRLGRAAHCRDAGMQMAPPTHLCGGKSYASVEEIQWRASASGRALDRIVLTDSVVDR